MPPKYEQHFREIWQQKPEFKHWLKPVANDSTRAFCAYCSCELAAKVTDIKKHSSTLKHKKKADPFSNKTQSKIVFATKSKCLESSSSEGSLAMFISEHCATLAVDHLTALCKIQFSDSKSSKDLQMHRTKCTNVIKNVLAPHFLELLRSDIGLQSYSLIIDESTDISVAKLLGVVIRYYSLSDKRIICTYLGIVQLENGTAQGIVSALKSLLKEIKLDIKNLVGIGVDNASVNVGINNGVYELLKVDNQHLIMVRCVCHSLQLALSHSYANSLPRNIDFLVKETYNWFSHSTKRQIKYKSIYKTINNDSEPLKIPKVCDTRWISIEPAVKRILQQWDELKLHFSIVREEEKCYTSEVLYEMYKDPVNKLYLLYLKTILNEVQRVTKAFESENSDPVRLLEDLTNLVQFLGKKIIIPTAKIDVLSDNFDSYIDPTPYLGYEFELFSKEINPQMLVNVKGRCIDFTKKLIIELRNRLPSNLKVLRKMNLFSSKNCLRVLKEPIIEIAALLGYTPEEVDKINDQWTNLTLIKWVNVNTTIDLWNEIYFYKDSAGINPFRELADLAVKILSLPHSNADVERLFSQTNIIKNKLRNRMQTSTLAAILTIKTSLKRMQKSCCTYVLPHDVISKIGTMKTYQSAGQAVDQSDENECDDVTDDEEEIVIL